MNKALHISKYLLIFLLGFIAIVQFILIIQNRAWDKVNLLGVLIPLFFVLAIVLQSRITWFLAVGIAIYGIVDVFYWGSYSATFPKMEFTQSLSEIINIHWLKRCLKTFTALFYPIVLFILLLPSVRRKYFRNAY